MDISGLSELGQQAHALVGQTVNIYYNPLKELNYEGSAEVVSIISTTEKTRIAHAVIKFIDERSQTYKRNILIPERKKHDA
jgi:hypothetical protein